LQSFYFLKKKNKKDFHYYLGYDHSSIQKLSIIKTI